MKRTIYFILFICLFLVLPYGCKKDEQPNNETKTIDKIELDQLKIAFGENSVDKESVSLELTETSTKEKENGLASSLYTLTLNENYDKKITITIPYKEKANDENTILLGIGLDFILNDKGDTDRIYYHYEAKIENDLIQASFVPSELLDATNSLGHDSSPIVKEKSKMVLYLGFFEDGCYFPENGHFKVWFPSGFKFKAEDRQKLLDDLETMYNYYKAKNYDLGDEPLSIHLKRGISEMGYFQPVFGDITMRIDYFEGEYDRVTILPVLYHEYFHYIQDNYGQVLLGNLWFNEATASYYEALYNKSTATGATLECYDNIFMGVIPHESTAQEGYARAPLIAYISKIKGNDSWIKTLYENKISNENISELINDLDQSFSINYYTALAKGDVGDRFAYNNYLDLTKGFGTKNMGTSLKVKIPDSIEIEDKTESGDNLIFSEIEIETTPNCGRFVAFEFTPFELISLPEKGDINFASTANSYKLIKINGKNSEVLNNLKMSCEDFKKSINAGDKYLMVLSTAKETNVKAYVELIPYIEQKIVSKIEYNGDWKFSAHDGVIGNGKIYLDLGSYKEFAIKYESARVDSYSAIINFANAKETNPFIFVTKTILVGEIRSDLIKTYGDDPEITLKYFFNDIEIIPTKDGLLNIKEVGVLTIKYSDNVKPNILFDLAFIYINM